jgi:hypothetical protein
MSNGATLAGATFHPEKSEVAHCQPKGAEQKQWYQIWQ